MTTIKRPVARRVSTSRRGRSDRGASAIETAILIPVLLGLLFLIIQAGLFYHARNVASSAAQVAVQRASVLHGTAADGQAAAAGYVQDTAGGVLLSPTVTVDRGATQVRAVVTGATPSLVPGVTLPDVTATAAAPVERLTTLTRGGTP